MSLIFPTTVAPSQATKVPRHAEARSDDQAIRTEGSFSEVLSRSLAPETEAGGETGKVRTSPPARRLASNQKAAPADPVNALALPVIQPQSQTMMVVSGEGAQVSIGNADPGAAGTLLASIPSDSLATGAEVSTDTNAKTAGVPELAMATPQEAKAAAPPIKPAASDSLTIASDPLKMTARPAATDRGASGQPSNAGKPAFDKPDDAANASADFSPKTTHSMTDAGTTATATATHDENAGSRSGSPPAPDPMALNYGLPAPAQPVSGALQGPAGMSAPNPSSHTATSTIAPEVGSGEWGKALGQQVIHMGKAGQQVAELQLNPPGLGPLKITLSMNEHQMQAMFVSEHSSVRAAVEAALPQLRNSLTDSGISLGNTSVGSGHQQQAAFTQGQSGGSGHRSSYQDNRPPDNPDFTAPLIAEPARRSDGITVDTYA